MPTHQPDAAEGGQQFEWSETLHAWLFRARIYLKRYWWIFLLTVSGGVGWQAYKEYNRPPSYLSNAQMEVESMVQTQMQQGVGVAENYMGFYATNIVIIEGQALKQKAIEQVMSEHPEFKTMTPPPDANAFANQHETTSFLDLWATGNNREFTQYFLDQVMEAFQTKRHDDLVDRAHEAVILADTQANNIKETINDIRAKEDKFFADNNTNAETMEQEEKSAGGVAGNLEEQEANLKEQQRIVAGIDLDRYVDGMPDKDGKIIYEPYVDEVDREVNKLGDRVQISKDYLAAKEELLHLNAVHDDFSKYLRDNHPKMVDLSARIAKAENGLNVLRRQIRTSIEAAHNDINKEIEQIGVTLKEAQNRANKYEKLLKAYTDIKQDLDMEQNTYNKLIEGSNQLQIASQLTMDTFKVTEKASPSAEQSPNKGRAIGQGAFVGLVLGTGLIFLLGALDGRVMSIEDLTQRFDEAMLGIIPMQKHIGGQVELLKSNDQRLMFAESCRNIRSSLLYMDKQGLRPQIIVVTSSIPSEGKSTISANLSITLGFAASRTLLVDADLRRGQLHKRFGLKNDVGLAEHIQDGMAIDKVIQSTGYENLEIITCGHYPAQPGELLMSARFNETLKVLRERYDFVVFDSPPVLATDDAVSFATRTDAVIFVVRAGYTRLRQIRTSLESLHRRGVNLYGMVVNFIDHREPSHYSYKYYDYYSYRPPESPTKPPFKSVTKDPFKDVSSGGR